MERVPRDAASAMHPLVGTIVRTRRVLIWMNAMEMVIAMLVNAFATLVTVVLRVRPNFVLTIVVVMRVLAPMVFAFAATVRIILCVEISS